MGNTKSQHPKNREIHQRLGEVLLSEAHDQQGNIYEQMTLIKLIETEAEFNRWYKDMTKIDDTVTREVLLLPIKTVFQSTGFCGSSGVVHLTYEHFPYVFEVQIQNRRKINRFFLQTQLWYLLYNMIRAGSKFEKYHSKIGDVHPSNILINNDGLVKLVSTCSFPRESTNFQKLIQNPKSKVFLAPEEIAQHAIEMADYPKNIDPSTAECFSIGLCMLAAGTLQDIDSIYVSDSSGRMILKHKLNLYLKQFGQKYSSFLHSLVMGLLADSPFERKKCSQIYTTLYEYQERILDLESFLPTNSRLINYGVPLQQSSTHFPKQLVQSNVVYQQPVSRGNVTNMYYNPNNNPVLVNPIQSLYVPANQLNFRPPSGYVPNGAFIPESLSHTQGFRNSGSIPINSGHR